jgi:pimeloyl-ACP methyl ester carboxylesterase
MEKRSRLDARKLAVSSGGAGDPVVLVHGFGSNKSIWKEVCDGLADELSFHAIDLPGAGESPAPRRFRYTLEHLADVLTELILIKGLKNVTLVGASLGGTVILLALIRNRDALRPRVRALCLIDAVAFPQDLPFFLELLRVPALGTLAVSLPGAAFGWRVLRRLPLDALRRSFEQYYGRRAVREALVRTARLIDPDGLAAYVERFAAIDLPTLVVWGRKDGIVPLRLGRRLARALPNARLLVLDDCGHSPHQQCPDEVAAALKALVRDARSNRASA